MSSRRIAMVTYAMDCGGVESFLLRLGSLLVRAGHQVDVITTEHCGPWFNLLAEHGIGARCISGYHAPWSTPARHARQVGQTLAAAEYEIVLVNNSVSAMAVLGMLPDDVIAIPVLHGMMDAG
jgi:hypothetical protein